MARLSTRVNCHTFRPTFATHLRASGHDMHKVQELPAYIEVRTTMIYAHVLSRGGRAVHSAPAEQQAETAYQASEASWSSKPFETSRSWRVSHPRVGLRRSNLWQIGEAFQNQVWQKKGAGSNEREGDSINRR